MGLVPVVEDAGLCVSPLIWSVMETLMFDPIGPVQLLFGLIVAISWVSSGLSLSSRSLPGSA